MYEDEEQPTIPGTGTLLRNVEVGGYRSLKADFSFLWTFITAICADVFFDF
jgi:hypothetical protein